MGRAPQRVQGSITILGHCSFEWLEEWGLRIVFVETSHCLRCIDEVRKLGFVLNYESDSESKQTA